MVGFFICVHCCGAGRSGRAQAGRVRLEKAASRAPGDVTCRSAGHSRAATQRARAPATSTAGTFLAQAPASQAQLLVDPVAHKQAFPSIPREPGPEFPTHPMGDLDTVLTHPLPV